MPKPEITMEKRGKIEKHKNCKFQIAKEIPWKNQQGYLIESIKIWNANYLLILFLGLNPTEISAQTIR